MMSKDKAINGSVKITYDREERWQRVEDLVIDNHTFRELLTEYEGLKKEYKDFRENTLLTLEQLVVSDKQNKKYIAKLEKALESFMRDVIKGGM